MSRARLARPTDDPPAAHAAPAGAVPPTAAGAAATTALPPVAAHVAIIRDGNRRRGRAHGRNDLEALAATAAGAIDEPSISARLGTAGIPDPDLVIRTGGEQRLSNSFTWQSAYAEARWCDTLWPDFEAADFDAALEDFARRSRRHGT